MSFQKLSYTDEKGVVKTVSVDLSKGLQIDSVPTALEWKTTIIDLDGVTHNEIHVGGRPKDRN